MNWHTLGFVLLLVAVCIAAGATCHAAGPKPRKPGPSDKCPVCGMFVAKYPDFAAQLHFRDGSVLFFDGNKDLFRYLRKPGRPGSWKSEADLSAVFVTDYYKLSFVDGRKAWYVIGSNVFGPMGSELISFAKEADAREFKQDHKGKAILRFGEVTPTVLKGLD